MDPQISAGLLNGTWESDGLGHYVPVGGTNWVNADGSPVAGYNTTASTGGGGGGGGGGATNYHLNPDTGQTAPEGMIWIPLPYNMGYELRTDPSYSKPDAGGGTTRVTINPADTTGAWSVITDPNTGQMYRVNKMTGEVTPVEGVGGRTTATNANDFNKDGFDDQTGLPNGTAKIGNDLYFQGVRINPNGSPMTPAQIAAADAGGGEKATIGGSLYEKDPATGKWVLAIRGPASSSGGGGASGGGGGGGGFAPDYSVQVAQINAASRSADQAASDAAAMARQTASLAVQKAIADGQLDFQKLQLVYDTAYKNAQLQQERAKEVAALSANPADMVQRELFLRTGQEPLGNPVDAFTGQSLGAPTTLSELLAANARVPRSTAMGTPLSLPDIGSLGAATSGTGTGTQPATSGSASPPPSGGPMSSAPWTPPTGVAHDLSAPPMQIDWQPVNPITRSMASAGFNGDTQSLDPYSPGYVAPGDYGAGSGYTPGQYIGGGQYAPTGSTTPPPSGFKEPPATGPGSLAQPWDTARVGIDPATGMTIGAGYPIPGKATGGPTTNRVFLGNEGGREMFINRTGAPIDVVPHGLTERLLRGGSRPPGYVLGTRISSILNSVYGDTSATGTTQPATTETVAPPPTTTTQPVASPVSSPVTSPAPTNTLNDSGGIQASTGPMIIGSGTPTGTPQASTEGSTSSTIGQPIDPGFWQTGGATTGETTGSPLPPPQYLGPPIQDTTATPPPTAGQTTGTGYNADGTPNYSEWVSVQNSDGSYSKYPPSAVTSANQAASAGTAALPSSASQQTAAAGAGSATPPASGGTGGFTSGNTTLDTLLGASGLGVLSYSGQTIESLPGFQYLLGKTGQGQYESMAGRDTPVPALGITLPAPNKLNYQRLLYLKENNPDFYAALGSLFKAGNRNIDAEMAWAKSRAPIGNAGETSLVQT